MMELTIDTCAESVLADVESSGLDGDVVIVAHSSGGLVVPGVARGLGVRHIVLNAASVPPEGGCGLDCMQPRHREGVEQFVAAARRDERATRDERAREDESHREHRPPVQRRDHRRAHD